MIVSEELKKYVEGASIEKLALVLPKYEFISPTLGIVILNDIRKLLF